MPLFSPAPRPDAQPARLLAFGLTYAGLHVGTVFLSHRFAIGLTLGDWVSLLIPWVVMGSAFLVWDTTPASALPRPRLVALLLLSALAYASGYGINLSANAAGRLLTGAAADDASRLIYFLDEHLGHILWHAGMVGATVGLGLAARTAEPARLTLAPALGAVAYSFAYFTDAVEGQTVPMLLPASVLIMGYFGTRPAPRGRPLLHWFILLAHGLALVQFGIWRLWQGGFPQFSEI